MKLKTIVMGIWMTAVMLHAVNVGEVLPSITLENENGGNSNGKAWHAQSLQGKVHVILYMDPDERKEAMPFLDALNAQNYDETKYSTIAIVNLAAMWMPDFVLATMLKKKQEALKNTTFIFDNTKYLVKKWQIKDAAFNVMIVDSTMKVLYQKSGVLSKDEHEVIMNILLESIK